MSLIVNLDWSHFFGDWYFARWCIFLFIFLGVFFWLMKKIDLWLSLAVTYCLGSSLFTLFFRYKTEQIEVLAHIRRETAFSFIILFVTSLVVFLKKEWIHKLTNVFEILFIVNIFWTTLDWIFPMSVHGLGANISINATLLALQYAYAPQKGRWLIPTAVVLCLNKTSMGILAFISGYIGQLYFKKKKTAIAAVLTGSLTMAIVDIFYFKHELFKLSYRDQIWTLILDSVEKWDMWWSGFGYGTWAFLGPQIQAMVGFKEAGWFVHAHSDWVQMIFEVGIPGTLLWILAFGSLFFKAYKSNQFWSVYFIVAFAGSMVGNMPLHLPLELLMLFHTARLIHDQYGALYGSKATNLNSNVG